MSSKQFLSLRSLWFAVVLSVVSVVQCSDTCPKVCQCNELLTKVNCKGKSLYTVPEGLPLTTEELLLNSNQLSEISVDSFSSLKSLVKLDLALNKISIIKKNSFKNQPKLRYLFLKHNDLAIIEEEAFVGAHSLVNLYLTSNRLKKISTFTGLDSIEKILMDTNDIIDLYFPPEIKQLKHLSYINLSNNKINSLTVKSLMNLNESNVRKLSFSRNKISSIEKDTFSVLTKIESLSLSENPLSDTVLQQSLSGLTNSTLISLDLSQLNLSPSLSVRIFQALQNTSLQTLILDRNKFTQINNEVFKTLQNLRDLKLDYCKIENISKSAFKYLSRLSLLSLKHNYLSKLTVDLPDTLLFLYLNDNKIKSIPKNYFGKMVYLRELHLQYNSIFKFDPNAFAGLEKLQKLKLSNNAMNAIPGRLFFNLVGLISLELNNNQITKFPKCLFNRLNELIYLNLANNFISSLPRSFSSSLGQLRYLYMSNNELGKSLNNDTNGICLTGLRKLEELDLSQTKIKGLLSKNLFKNQTSLKQLWLSKNSITLWHNETFKPMYFSLQKFDISHNSISHINANMMVYLDKIKSLNINNNPFACTCDLRSFRSWLRKTQVHILDEDKLMCNSPSSWQGKKLLDFDSSKIDCFNYTPVYVISGLVGGLLITTILGSIAYAKRWYIMFKFYKWHEAMKRNKRPPNFEAIPGDDIYFDAYICYCDDDIEWIQTNLMPIFDRGENEGVQFHGKFKLCLKERDFKPGRFIPVNVAESIKCSTKVIVILTENFKNQARLQFDLNIAIMVVGYNNIIVIKVGKLRPHHIPDVLNEMVKEKKYIEWDYDRNAIKLFTQQLQTKLEEKN